jgi:hypothetical protein
LTVIDWILLVLYNTICLAFTGRKAGFVSVVKVEYAFIFLTCTVKYKVASFQNACIFWVFFFLQARLYAKSGCE